MLCFEFENELKFYKLRARLCQVDELGSCAATNSVLE